MPSPHPRQTIGIVLAVALLVWAGVHFYRDHVRHNLWPRNFGVVAEGKVFRAAAQAPATLARLIDQHQIRTVIDLGAFTPGSREEQQTLLVLKSRGVQRFEFRLVGDGTGDPNHYVRALRAMTDPALQPVLVHCATGAQRTSACVAFYRHVTQQTPLDDAYAEARDYKHDPRDNPKLKPYIDRWAEPISRAFRSGQPIPVPPADPAR